MNLLSLPKKWYMIGCIGLSILVIGVFLLVCKGLEKTACSSLVCDEDLIQVVSSGSVVYAKALDCEINQYIYSSSNGGFTWQTTTIVPDELNLPSYDKSQSVCHPNIEQLCFRISMVEGMEEYAPELPTKLEQSKDGGVTWQEVRFPFHLRSETGCRDSYPRSLTFVELNEQNQTYNLIVAAGGSILVYSSDGQWLQIGLKKMND
jgi:hypothetical protein